MKKIVLVKSEAKNAVIAKLFEESKNGCLPEVEVIDIERWIDHFFPNPKSLYQLKKELMSLDLVIFKDSLDYTGFLREVKNYSSKLSQYIDNFDTLPINEELKIILTIARERDYRLLCNQLEKLDASNIVIADLHYDLFEEKVINILLAHGAKKVSYFKKKSNTSYIKDCQTISDQFETAVQYIISKELPLSDCAFLLCTDDENLAQATLERYGMPYFGDKARTGFSSALDLRALLRFIEKPCKERYIQVLQRNIFTPCNNETIHYIVEHVKEGHYLDSFSYFETEESYFRTLEERAIKAQEKTAPPLIALLDEKDFKKQLALAFSYIPNKGDEKYKLLSFLQERGKDAERDFLPFLIEDLANTFIAKENNNGILLTTFKKPVYDRPYLFIFDMDGKVFPGFKGFEGLVNEEILANTNYPSLKERTDNYLKSLSYLDDSSLTIYFHPLSTYEGKECPLPVLIEKKNLEALDFELIKSEVTYNNEHKLSKENAKKAFFENDSTLKGSVSSFESYFRCPYSYFLNRGLSLYEDKVAGFDPATVGNIYHHLFETIVSLLGKDYPLISSEKIRRFLKPQIDHLRDLYPERKRQADMLEENILDTVMIHLQALKKFEDNTYFKPYSQEHKFDLERNFKSHPISFHGRIDRIDELNDTFCIIDYKTGERKINEDDIKSGISLQLLTYCYLYELITGKKPFGAAYYSLAIQNINTSTCSFKKSKGLTYEDKDPLEDLLSNFKPSGFAFENEEDYFISEVKAKAFDKDAAYKALDILYEALYASLADGKIECEPVEKACTYCPYKEICHFKGREGYFTREYVDFSLLKSKEKEEE